MKPSFKWRRAEYSSGRHEAGVVTAAEASQRDERRMSSVPKGKNRDRECGQEMQYILFNLVKTVLNFEINENYWRNLYRQYNSLTVI
jgi:hypothetical protein